MLTAVREVKMETYEYVAEILADHKISGWENCGLLAASTIRLSKQATIEKRFILRKLGKLEPVEISDIKSLLRRIFS